MHKLSLAVAVLLITITMNAQSKQEKEVADAVEKLRKAMVDADSVALSNLAADGLTYGHSGGSVETKADFVRTLVSGKSDFVTMDLKNQTIAVSEKTAIVRHRLDATTNDNAKPGEVHLLILLVFQKQNKQWKLLARQAVKVPQ